MDDQFEENLRHILSHGPVPKNGESGDAAAPAPPARPVIKPTRKYQQAVDRYEKEQKTLFWFRLLRPVAFAALLGLLALFVMRITSAGA